MSKINLGILGGGQLGSMLATAAKKLNVQTFIYCDDENAPAQKFADDFILGDYNDENKISEFVNKVNIVTYEFENIPFIPEILFIKIGLLKSLLKQSKYPFKSDLSLL